jgi:hypothetical protein
MKINSKSLPVEEDLGYLWLHQLKITAVWHRIKMQSARGVAVATHQSKQSGRSSAWSDCKWPFDDVAMWLSSEDVG